MAVGAIIYLGYGRRKNRLARREQSAGQDGPTVAEAGAEAR